MRIGLTRYKNRGFNCESFARIDSRESRCESPVPLRGKISTEGISLNVQNYFENKCSLSVGPFGRTVLQNEFPGSPLHISAGAWLPKHPWARRSLEESYAIGSELGPPQGVLQGAAFTGVQKF